MKKTLTLASLGLLLSLSYGSSAAIFGYAGACVGSGNTLTDSAYTPGSGVWSSSNPAIVTINATTGLTHGVSAGTAIISYVVGAATDVFTYTISPAPATITGTYSMCVGTTATLTNAIPGGTWNSGNNSIATINASTGVATGVSAGTVWMYYSTGPGCSTSTMDTVTGSSVTAILGDSMLCAGTTATLTNASPGGTWSSSNPSVATISSTGVVTAIAAGVSTITYTYMGTCGTTHSTRDVFVSSTTSPGAITGTTTISVGGSATLSDAPGGGTWSSSNTSIVTINSAGMITGVATGTATISYTVSGCSGIASATTVVSVTALNCISGSVIFTGAPYWGSVRVWLIKYNPATHLLAAVDSTTVTALDSFATYQFCGMDSATYRVKAAVLDSASTSGYVPTYHTSSFYWNAATTFFHSVGTADIAKNIIMGLGTATSGPGFIAGDVTMGANKGTSGTIPSVGLLIYAQDNATGVIMQQTTTDATGHYSFSNLPIGTYRIYPELINYATTPYTAISLTSAAPSMTAASFVQHTVSYKITPGTTAVGNVSTNASYISTFPNPTSGKLNVNYEIAATEQATLTVTDVTGRAVYTTGVELTKGAGTTSIDLSAISNGLYMISIKSASVNYNNKIQVQK